jgi:hypothetical protein
VKYILFIFTITITLSAQYEWSTPVQLSEQGIYPDSTFSRPAITADSNGILYAFWIKGIQIGSDLRWYSQIEYRKSYNDGISWSTTENLTPDYTTERIYDIQALCDSENNIHLIYNQTVTGSEYSKILHKRFYNNTWQEPVEVYRYYTSALKTGIDKRDRLYVTWFLGPADTGTAYYSFCDALSDTISWNPGNAISQDKLYGIRSFPVFDGDNNLYCCGDDRNTYYPYLYKYNPVKDIWVYENILSQRADATALVLSNNNRFNVSIMIGPTTLENQNYLTTREFEGSIWTDLEFINENNDIDKEMFLDRNDKVHLFEMHFGFHAELAYTNNYQIDWKVETIRSDSVYSYGTFDVAFNNEDRFYLIYRKINSTNNDPNITFQTKQIEVGIDNNDTHINDFMLYQNYPNPFNNETVISFSIPEPSEIQLNIYNIKGESVDKLISKKMNIGIHSVNFKANVLNSGIYYYQLTVNGKIVQTKSMLYLK